MASYATAMNIVHMNNKQLHQLATNVGVSSVTINANTVDGGRPDRNAALITAIKAK